MDLLISGKRQAKKRHRAYDKSGKLIAVCECSHTAKMIAHEAGGSYRMRRERR